MTEERLHLDLTALFEPAPEGGYVARFAELPDVFSEGETLEEARANLFDALQLVMDYHREQMERDENPMRTTIRQTLHLTAAP